MSKKPIAVLVSDVHYSLSTLELADKAFRAAIDKAAELGVPLIDCGDITNDKAIIRAEVANRLIETMRYAYLKHVGVTLLVGNHSLINEKGKEHALNFLRQYVDVIDRPEVFHNASHNLSFIPYQTSNERFVEILHTFDKHRIVIAHQGFRGANMGDYIQDTSSVDPKDCEGYRIISGHYHRHQTLGNITYVGNPYTLTFGEANDGPKGFLVLYADGSFDREILHLRKHIIVEGLLDETDWKFSAHGDVTSQDLVWIKLKGPKRELDRATRSEIMKIFPIAAFRLDLCPNDVPITPKMSQYEKLTDSAIFDKLIGDDEDLKKLWREIYENS